MGIQAERQERNWLIMCGPLQKRLERCLFPVIASSLTFLTSGLITFCSAASVSQMKEEKLRSPTCMMFGIPYRRIFRSAYAAMLLRWCDSTPSANAECLTFGGLQLQLRHGLMFSAPLILQS